MPIDLNEDEKKKGPEGGGLGKNCVWITSCLFAGFFMGTGAFLYAANYSEYGLSGTGILGPGATIMFLLVKIFRELKHYYKTKAWFKQDLKLQDLSSED